VNYKDKIIAKIKTLDVGKPIFKLIINEQRVRLNEGSWEPNLDGTKFYNKLINCEVYRAFNVETKAFYIDEDEAIKKISNNVIRSIFNIFISCSSAKMPKRTKIYKQFQAVVKENRSKIEFVNSIFDIAEYYYQVTQTDSIKKRINDVHRKNIYQLLCLMEKSYEKNKTNSNQ